VNIEGDQALARVRAGLGRDPQDTLEAAIALESGGGIIGNRALDLGRRATHVARHQHRPPPGRPVDRDRTTWTAPATVGLVLVSLMWGGMLVSGASDLDPTAVLVGLPVGLGLVGYLDRRFTAGDEGPRRTRANVLEVCLSIAVPCLAVGLLHPGGVVAVGVILILVCTAFAARFGVAAPVIVVIVAGYAADLAGARPEVAAVASLGIATAIVVAEVVRLPPLPLPPARLTLAVPRALAGFGLGLLTVPVVDLTTGLVGTRPLLVILPSTIGGAIAAGLLERMWFVIGDALDAAHAGRRPDRTVGRVYVRLVLVGAVVALGTTAALSVAVWALVPEVHDPDAAIVLGAMAAIALAGYSATVLQGVGAEVDTMVGLMASGVTATAGTLVTGHIAASVVVAVAAVHLGWLPTLIVVFRDPERVLATRV
jgi:hypothetical protein